MRSPLSMIHLGPDVAEVSSGRELRVAPRIACEIPVKASINGDDYASAISDISASGVAMFLSAEVELGEVFRLSFVLPGEDNCEVDCAGLVRSCRPVGEESLIGMELHNLVDGARSSIASFVHLALESAVTGDQRPRWGATADLGTAVLLEGSTDERAVLRWSPGLATLFAQVAKAITERETVFVPTLDSSLREGDQLYLEVVPPLSHAVFRMLAEVVWVERGGFQAEPDGVGLRLGGLSPMDRHLLTAIQAFYQAADDRYR